MRMDTLLAMCAAVGVLAGVACGGGDGGRPSGSPQAPSVDAAQLARAAADRMEAVTSFRFVVEHERGASPITSGLLMRRAEGETVAPDRLQADIDATAPQLGNAAVRVRVVAVGDVSRMTNPFDRTRWMPVPGTALQELFDPARGTVSALRAATDHVVTGEEVVGGTPCWVVAANVDGGALKAFAPVAQAGYPVRATLWIGKEDPLLHRVRLEGQMGPRDTADVVRVVQLSRFDLPVAIELAPE
jgi:hypothetical protein